LRGSRCCCSSSPRHGAGTHGDARAIPNARRGRRCLRSAAALEAASARCAANKRTNTRLQQAEATNRVLRDELLGIGQRAALLEDSVSKLADPDRHGAQALRLDEVEMLLGMAQQRLQLASDLDGARRAYALAAGLLDGIDDPAYLSLRRRSRRSAARSTKRAWIPSRTASHDSARRTRARRLPRRRRNGKRARAPGGSALPRAWSTCGRAIARNCARRSDRAAGMEALASNSRSRAPRWNAATRRLARALGRADAWLPRLWPDSPRCGKQRASCRALRAQSLAVSSPVLGSTLVQLRSMRAR
jgi:uroporphyrin-3 C-methyltransferase